MKAFLELLLKVVKSLFPKSRWGNVAYLILGFVIANYDAVIEIIKSIGDLLK